MKGMYMTTTAQTELLQLVTFRLGEEEYAVNVTQVQEIVRLTSITAVPRSPNFVEGVINLRGRIVPVVDLAKRLDLPTRERTNLSRIVITQVENRTIGMRVDAVSEVLRLDPGLIDPPSDLLKDGRRDDYFVGVGKYDDRLLILLDLPKVLTSEDTAALAGVGAES
jgi:purine-binding chemotaxis protein CheW